MDFGISTKVIRDFEFQEGIELAASLGYDAVEIWVDDLLASGMSYDAVTTLFEKHGLHKTIHLRTDDINIASFNEGIRRESIKQTKEGIWAAAQIGATEVTLHPGRKTSKTNTPEEVWKVQIAAITELAEYASDLKINLCVEGMENLKGEVVCMPSDLLNVLNACNNEFLKVTIDIAHLQTWGDAVALLEEARTLPIANVHISQTSEGGLHLPLFDTSGLIDYVKIFHCLNCFYSGAVVVEGYKKGQGKEIAQRSIEWYKNILKECERQ